MFLGRTGQIDSAITEFQTALKYNPKSAATHYDLGSALGLKGDLEGTKMHYLMAQRLDPKRIAVYDDLGVLYLRQGQLAEGIAQLREALRLQPNDTLAAENLRRAEEMQLNSKQHFQPALTFSGGNNSPGTARHLIGRQTGSK